MNFYVPDIAHNKLIEEIMSPIFAGGEIVGVIGEWGTGKTTVANNAISAVEDCKEVHSMHINLWMVEHYSEVEDIFFEVLAKELKVRNFENLSNLFFEYSLTLKHAGTKIEKLLKIIERIIKVIGILGISFSIYLEKPEFQFPILILGLVLYTLGPLLLGASWALTRVKSILNRSKWFTDNRLIVQRKIENEIQKLGVPFVVVIDDIDRISHSKLVDFILFISSEGRFKNTKFLVLGSKSTMELSVSDEDKEHSTSLKSLCDRYINLSNQQRRFRDAVNKINN